MKRRIRPWTVRSGFVLLLVLGWALASFTSAAPAPEWRWYKGNLHTHTTHSDGDSSPEFVARWYKEHHYQFLVLSDHNYFTEPAGLNIVMGAKERFLLIGGEEVTSKYQDKAVHLNAYGISRLVPPQFGASVLETIQQNVDVIVEAGGIPSLNHPNFRWSITPAELKSVNGLKLVEVYNGHPTVHNEGGGGKPSHEQIWDVALTAGRRIFAVAVDDAHYFKSFGSDRSNPGRGWVMVKAAELTSQAILQAIEEGEFYASTGVELADVTRTGGTLRIRIKQDRDFTYTTRFIGAGGNLLAESFDLESSYTLTTKDPYIRATITDSMGRRAWVQPVFKN